MGISTLSRSSSSERPRACCEEEAFYSHYDWCLNPILSLGQLLLHLHEELDRAPRLAAPWQRAESRINLFLFICAIACTLDDELNEPLADLSPIRAHFPRLRLAVTLAERALDGVQALRGAVARRPIVRWRRDW